MENKNQTDSPGQARAELSIEELKTKKSKLARVTRWLALFAIVALAGLAWGVRDWISPDVRTSDTWTLPVSLIFFVEMAALLTFCLGELKRLNRQIKQKQTGKPKPR